MSHILIDAACVLAIATLFVFDRGEKARTSAGLWITVAWLLIAGSRSVSMWIWGAAPVMSADRYLEGNPIDRAVLGTLTGVGIVILMRRAGTVSRVLRANAPIVCFFLYCALSVFWSEFPEVAFKRWIRGVGDFVMILIILTEAKPWTAIRRVLAWTSFVLLPLSVVLIRYYPDLGRQYSRDWELMYTGVTTQKNELGVICAILGLASVWRLLWDYRNAVGRIRLRRMLVHGFLAGTAVCLLWIANSVTASSCFVMGTLVMLFLSLPKIRSSSFVVQTVVGLTVLIPFAILFLNMSGDTIASLGRNSTLTGRTQVWERALELITHPICGSGYESFWLGQRLATMSEVQPGINQAHNGYLEIFLNLGWCGIALLAILIASGYRNVIAAFRLHQDGGLLKIALFAVAISYNFTEAGFKMMNPMWIAFLWATTRTPRVATVPSRTGRTAAALRENASDSPYALEWNSCFRPRNDGNGKPGEVTSRADPLQTV